MQALYVCLGLAKYRHMANGVKFLVVKKLVEQTFEIRMVRSVSGTTGSLGLMKRSCRDTSHCKCRQKFVWSVWFGQDDG